MEDMGLITGQELAVALAIQYRLKTALNFSKAYFSPELLDIVKADTALQNLIFPLKLENNILCVAVFDPSNVKILQNISANNSLSIVQYVSSRSEINKAIYQHYFGVSTIDPLRRTVLVVDDDHLVLDKLVEILSPHYKILTATNGMDAYKEAVTKKPHVIVTDKEMPKLDGFGLLSALQNMHETRKIPVILVSAATDTELESKAFKSGFFDFIQKPIRDTTILTRVKRAFNFCEQPNYSI